MMRLNVNKPVSRERTKKKWKLYEWNIVLFFLIIPLGAIFIDYYMMGNTNLFVEISLKWFVFSGIGLRLGISGIKQIFHPQFTLNEIFNISGKEAIPIVRELGFANLCFSILAIISLFYSDFRIPASIAGGLYFGLAGILHVLKKKESSKEVFAMISDIYIFIIMIILLIFNL